jgi:hypothetical protein
METFIRNHTFEVEIPLTYADDDSEIDIDGLTELTVVFRKINEGPVLCTRKLSLNEIVPKASATGVNSIAQNFINKLDTIYAEKGDYEAIVTPELTDANYTGNLANPATIVKCFTLA